MPELPEVETVVRLIRPELTGCRITSAEFRIPRQLAPQKPSAVRRAVAGSTIRNVRRRGKYILCDLDRGTLVLHLRMTGRLYIRSLNTQSDEHERAFFGLEGERVLVFRDPRTLGTIRYYPVGEALPFLDKLGWEPLHDQVSVEQFRERVRNRSIVVKVLLLDQSVWAGIGNIYASESLWEAGIHPLVRADRLTRKQCEKLMHSVPMVLKRALSRGGTTLRDFVSPDGKKGSYQREFRVYGREGEPCPNCGSPIIRITQAQRSTYFCRKCQMKR